MRELMRTKDEVLQAFDHGAAEKRLFLEVALEIRDEQRKTNFLLDQLCSNFRQPGLGHATGSMEIQDRNNKAKRELVEKRELEEKKLEK